ncbi:MAG: hypothetical protein Q4G30_02275 [Actinomycetaceae bacterium]|nr:hypothetical protein [Actinomycetaceae bacterium]
MRYINGVRIIWSHPGNASFHNGMDIIGTLTNLSTSECQLVSELRLGLTLAEYKKRASRLRITPNKASRILKKIRELGVLTPATREGTSDTEGRYWLRRLGSAHLVHNRSLHTVMLTSLDPLGRMLALGLACAGIGTLITNDTQAIPWASSAWWGLNLVGMQRREGLRLDFKSRGLSTKVTTSATEIDLLVSINSPVEDPVLAQEALSRGIPHLPITFTGTSMRVGPLVTARLGPCIQCVNLHRTQLDPAWPLTATQLYSTPPLEADASLIMQGAGKALSASLSFLDRRDETQIGAVNIINSEGQTSREEIRAHPDCGCHVLPAALVSA